MSALSRRVRTGLLLGPLFLAVALVGPRAFAVGLAILILLGAWELWRLLQRLGLEMLPWMPLGALFLFALGSTGILENWELPLAIIAWGGALALLLRPPEVPAHPREKTRVPAARSIGAHLLGALYLGLLPSFLIRLYEGGWSGAAPAGTGVGWLFFAIFSIWSCDTGAYLVGSAWGKHPLWPSVSPKKTWEGVAGGAIASVLFAIFVGPLLNTGLSGVEAAGLGFLVALTATTGDLIESRIKRIAQVKDSGALFPGHGGVLDRFDSLFFAAPLFYYYLLHFGR
jgi:phosphatidate cytidylyltransferase